MMPRLPKGILGLPTRQSFAVLTKASCRWNGVQKSRKWFRHAPNIKTVAGNYATKGRLISVTPSHLSIMVEHGWTVIGFPVLVLFLLEIVWNMILVTSTAVESMPVNSEVATATGEHNIYTCILVYLFTCPHNEWFQETLHSICKLTTVLNTDIKLSFGLGFVQTIFEHI